MTQDLLGEFEPARVVMGEFEIVAALMAECNISIAAAAAPTLDFSKFANSQNLAVVGA